MGLRIGVVLHPSRDVSEPLRVAEAFAARAGSAVVQLAVEGEGQQLAPDGDVTDCDLVVAIGGDGTALAAIRTAAPADRPVLGVGCGSLGALSTISPAELADSLQRFADGDWTPARLPALEVHAGEQEPCLAYNDAVVVRRRQGQVRVAASVDGELYARLAGDGAVVSTAAGSSAYALAAGGPLLAPGLDAFLFTPLPSHGGSSPPLVVGAERRLELELLPSYGGARLELDGRIVLDPADSITVTLRRGAATLVAPGPANRSSPVCAGAA